MSDEELSTLKALLSVSDKRFSQNQKNCLRHLLDQYEILNFKRMQEDLLEMENQ